MEVARLPSRFGFLAKSTTWRQIFGEIRYGNFELSYIFSTEDQTAIPMSDVRCPSCGDSFRVPDFAVPACGTAKCPWCGDCFRSSTLVAYLPPFAELFGEDGEPISLAELAQASAQAAAPLAVLASSPIDTDPAILSAVDLQDRDFAPEGLQASGFDTDELDAASLVGQRLTESEVANDVREFAEDGVTFADAGLPEPTEETTEWNLDSPLVQPSIDADETPIEIRLVEARGANDWVDEAARDDNFESEFGIQSGSPPRPLAEVTDVGLGREERVFVSRPRAKQRQAAPMKSIIGIVIGGLMAFPLAAGILALAGKPLDLGFWPFDGDTIALSSGARRSAAMPLDPSPRSANNENRGGRSLADDLPSLDVDPPSLDVSSGDVAGSVAGQPATELPDDLENLLLADTSPGRDLTEITRPSSTIEFPPLDLSTPAAAAAEPEMVAEIAESNPAEATADPVATEQPVVEEIAAMPATPVVDEPVADTPPQTLTPVSAELQSALEEASDAMGEVVNYDDSEGVPGQRKRLAILFEKVAAIGSIASTADEAAVGSLVQRLVDSDLVTTLSPAAPNWARFSRRPNKGMLATGKLRRDNDRWMLDWTGPAPLEVRFSDESIAEAGASVIILGTIEQTDPSTIVAVTYLRQQ